MAWKMGGFPLDEVTVRSKTGSAEVYGKQSTGVGRVLHQGLRRGDDDQPGRHRLRHRPATAIREIWEALYGIDGETVVNPPGRRHPRHRRRRTRCRRFADDGSILPPARKED